MKCEQHKIRKSLLSEDEIKEMAAQLKERYFTGNELMIMAKSHGYKGSLEVFLSLFAVRGYLFAEQNIRCKKTKGQMKYEKVVYKIVTNKDYEEYEQEAKENAKRRLLAAVSY